MRKRKIAVIAAGFTGEQHTEAVRRIPGNEVVALVGTDLKALTAKAKVLGVEHVYTDYKKMIEEIRPDVVHNCTPNGLHYEINKYVMEQGIHIYSEKPLAVTVKQGEELLRIAEEKHVAAGVNFNYRNNAIVQEMKERVKNGSVGRIFHVTGQYIQDWMMFDSDYNWRLTADMGGASRTIADIGSHWFDTVQCVLGKKITAVCAEMLTVHPFRKKPKKEVKTFEQAESGSYELVPVDSEDAAFIMVRFEDETIGTVNLSQVSGGHLNDLRLEVSGEKCSLEWQQQNPDTLVVGTRGNGLQILRAAPGTLSGSAVRYATLPGGHPVGWSDALRNGIREYYASIEAGTYSQTGQAYATFADGVQIMKLVEACMESAKIGKWVNV